MPLNSLVNRPYIVLYSPLKAPPHIPQQKRDKCIRYPPAPSWDLHTKESLKDFTAEETSSGCSVTNFHPPELVSRGFQRDITHWTGLKTHMGKLVKHELWKVCFLEKPSTWLPEKLQEGFGGLQKKRKSGYSHKPTVDGKKKFPPGILAVTRYHSIGEVPGSVEMVSISFPELPMPTRNLNSSNKP